MRPVRPVRSVLVSALTLWMAAQTATPRPALAAAGDVLPFAVTEATLANGLRVIVVPTGMPNLVSIRIPVQVGSRNEVEPGKSGFAHFFEHLMFRGTPTMPPEKYREIMSRAGARDNASTDADRTTYFSTFAKDHLESVIGVYADMFQHLAYSEADFKTEARAILGEYNKNAADPGEKLFEVQHDRYFRSHTYKHTTMGFIQDIENMPNEYEYSKAFFRRWYRPEYTTLVVTGDVTPQQVMPLVEKYWSGWTSDGGARVSIPQEPAPAGPLYTHVSWASPTAPYVTVAFPSPAFSETSREHAAMSVLSGLYFGHTSALYKRLVVAEQKADMLEVDLPASVDPSLITVYARVKKAEDAVYVRDQILATVAAARASLVPERALTDAKAHDRYAFARTLDSTERIAAVVARYASFRRSYETVNAYYRAMDAVTTADVQAAARKYFSDAGLIVATLAKDPLPEGISRLPALGSLAPAQAFADAGSQSGAPSERLPAGPPAATLGKVIVQKSVVPQLDIKLLFTVGSAHDPVGKEGLAALTASMIARAGSKASRIEEIDATLYPIAASFDAHVDKEMTTFTGVVHRDHWQTFLSRALTQLLDPGFRPDDFARLKDRQLAALVQDLRSNNEEELGRERLQTNAFRATPYAHVALGTVAGLAAITLDDVKAFAAAMYTRANLTLGVSGDVPDEAMRAIQSALGTLPEGKALAPVRIDPARTSGLTVEIIEKDTRSTAISLGAPIEVTRAHPDFVALSLARTWFGEHRITSGQLFQRIREVRGINYGDYAYIEAFPRAMFQFFPDSNIARRRQLFEIWIRPVGPANAHMTLRIALHELDQLVQKGMTAEQFDATRGYLMNNVYVMTATQDQQLGYALDSSWYGIGEFTAFMRQGLERLTLEQVNRAIRTHLNAHNLSVVCITRDAAALKQALEADAFSPIRYDGTKPAALLAEDQVIGARRLDIAPSNIVVTPVAEVFAR